MEAHSVVPDVVDVLPEQVIKVSSSSAETVTILSPVCHSKQGSTFASWHTFLCQNWQVWVPLFS